jgi:hypothetical protein
MDLIESGRHSFIVTVWMEETTAESGRPTWRGHVTHAASRERQYFSTLDEIPTIIAPFLEGMGAKLSIFWRVKRWIQGGPR